MFKKATQKGFTLIELLVVIAIIALLSSVVMASISKARQTAEIRKFEQELINIRTAIQLYREKHNGAWPLSPTVHINTLVNKLYNDGLYNKSTIDIPKGVRNATTGTVYPRFYYGYKSSPNNISYFSCGGPNHKDVYFTLGVHITDAEVQKITTLPKAYYYTNLASSGGVYCLEIR